MKHHPTRGVVPHKQKEYHWSDCPKEQSRKRVECPICLWYGLHQEEFKEHWKQKHSDPVDVERAKVTQETYHYQKPRNSRK